MPIKYIGRTTDFKGKTLWEILGNLKNFGVGRYVMRNRFIQRYPEPTYHKILKVQSLPQLERTNPHDNPRKVIALTEKIFRGIKTSRLVEIDSVSYKSDYLLVPKEDEEKILRPFTPPPPKVLPRTTEYPPLLKQILIRQMKATGAPVTEPRLPVKYNFTSKFGNKRVAEENETPDFELETHVDPTKNPQVYGNIKE